MAQVYTNTNNAISTQSIAGETGIAGPWGAVGDTGPTGNKGIAGIQGVPNYIKTDVRFSNGGSITGHVLNSATMGNPGWNLVGGTNFPGTIFAGSPTSVKCAITAYTSGMLSIAGLVLVDITTNDPARFIIASAKISIGGTGSLNESIIQELTIESYGFPDNASELLLYAFINPPTAALQATLNQIATDYSNELAILYKEVFFEYPTQVTNNTILNVLQFKNKTTLAIETPEQQDSRILEYKNKLNVFNKVYASEKESNRNPPTILAPSPSGYLNVLSLTIK